MKIRIFLFSALAFTAACLQADPKLAHKLQSQLTLTSIPQEHEDLDSKIHDTADKFTDVAQMSNTLNAVAQQARDFHQDTKSVNSGQGNNKVIAFANTADSGYRSLNGLLKRATVHQQQLDKIAENAHTKMKEINENMKEAYKEAHTTTIAAEPRKVRNSNFEMTKEEPKKKKKTTTKKAKKKKQSKQDEYFEDELDQAPMKKSKKSKSKKMSRKDKVNATTQDNDYVNA